MSTTTTAPAANKRTKGIITTEYALKSGQLKMLVDKGEENWSEDDITQALALKSDCEGLRVELEKFKGFDDFKTASADFEGTVKTGINRPSMGVPTKTGEGHDGAVTNRNGEVVYQGDYSQRDEDTEAFKFMQRGPFKSLTHFCAAVKDAGERPAHMRDGVIGEYRAGVTKHDAAIKAIACKGVDIKSEREVKAITGLGEFADAEAALLIPMEFSAGIWNRVIDENEVLSLFEMIPVTGNSLTVRAYQDKSRADGSRMGGVAGYWKGEAEQFTSSKPTFRTIDAKLNKLTVLVYATEELLEDAPAADAEITRCAAGEIGFKLQDALVRGNGVGMPLGYLNAACKVAIVSNNGAEATISATDVDNMWARRAVGSGRNYIWLANQDIEPQLAQLRYAVADSGAIWLYVPAGGITEASPARLKGKPIYFIEQAETLGTEGDLTLIDPTQYLCIVKSQGLKSAISMHLRFDYDEQAFKFTYRADFRPRWEASLTRFKGSNALSPIVTIESTRGS